MSTKLYYFDGRGKAEIVRLTLAAAGIPFTEVFLKERDEITKWRSDGLLLFDQVPMLEIDGLRLVQTGAIVRYIGRKAGLYGKNNEESTRIDMMYEGSRDFYSFFLSMVFKPEEEVLKTVKEKALPRYLPIFDKVLRENGTGYLVGDQLTVADVGLLETLLAVEEYLGQDVFKDFPSLQTFCKKLTTMEKISMFLNGPQRKKKNDELYVSTVKKTLNF